MKPKRIAPVIAALALAVAGAICFYAFPRGGGDVRISAGETVRTVRLANRTVSVTEREGSVPAVPEMPQVLSGRGTAPFLVVARGKASRPARERAERCGARVTGVVPPHGIVVEADAAALRRIAADGSFLAVEALSAEDRTSGSLRRFFASGADEAEVTVVPLRAEDSAVIAEILEGKGCEIIRTVGSDAGSVRAKVSAATVEELAGRGDVRWIERFHRPRPLTDEAMRPGLLNVTPIHRTYGLTGKGQTITVSDTGLDTGDPDTVMSDFSGRITKISTEGGCYTYDRTGHGTHVAGILAGNGAESGGWFRGVAYESRLRVFQCLGSDGYLYVPAASVLLGKELSDTSYIHSGSWGAGETSEYTSFSVEFDSFLWLNPDVLAVFAAGNRERAEGTVTDPAGAKNVIAVGATENLRPYEHSDADNPSQVALLSSVGPMPDGRIKPDVCAPGTYVVSTRSTKTSNAGWGLYPGFSRYMYNGGTSMATPFVSGCAALVRQWLVERRLGQRPTGALIKAVLTGGAFDMSADAGADCGGAAPNSVQGWGRVDLGRSLYPVDATVMLADNIPYSDGSSYSVKVTLPEPSPLSVQLVWTDYPGTPGAARTIVNDLDLVVSNETTGAVWYGNGVSGGDRVNTAESVRISAAEAAPGVYRVYVKGADVMFDSTEGGAAALYVRGAFSEEVSDSWNGDERTEFTVRSYMILSSGKGWRWKSSAVTAAKGQTLRFSVPESIPGGSESVDVSSSGKTFADGDGSVRTMKVQRLGRIEVAAADSGSGTVVTNAAGHMATSFSVTVDGDKDVLFRFYDEASTNAASSLPAWWYARYVEGDPLADTVRFVSVSPASVEWTGGAASHVTLERTASLGEDADWRAVFERPPAPVLTNSWPVPAAFSTNSFFRVRPRRVSPFSSDGA